MAFEIVTAVQTPFPPPDISSPKRSFANLSFIISSSPNNINKVKLILLKIVLIQEEKFTSNFDTEHNTTTDT